MIAEADTPPQPIARNAAQQQVFQPGSASAPQSVPMVVDGLAGNGPSGTPDLLQASPARSLPSNGAGQQVRGPSGRGPEPLENDPASLSQSDTPQLPGALQVGTRPLPLRYDGGQGTPGSGSANAGEPPGRRSVALPPMAAEEGVGVPGGESIEGPQAPQILIQKIAPDEVQVGVPAVFRIQVVNSGKVTAHGVEIHDVVPRGTKLLKTSPQATAAADGRLIWRLGTLNPGSEASVEVQLLPTTEGQIGSVATVHFAAEASARTVCTKPELTMKIAGPDSVLVGREATVVLTLSNPGSGVARSVVIEAQLPPQLSHPAGPELVYEVGELKPNESRQLTLKLKADQAGEAVSTFTARAGSNLAIDAQLPLDVLAPQLQVEVLGPSRRYLEREASFEVAVSNPGTAVARNVELVAYLPSGMQFVAANNAGRFDAAAGAVRWNLEELPASETGSVRLTVLPTEAGQFVLRCSGSAELGLKAQAQHAVEVEGISAILFQVMDVDDPIELGAETTYEIRVVNQGSKVATNLQVVADVPQEMRPVGADGPVRHVIEGNRVMFESLPRLAPKADTTYRVRVQGLKPGDLRLRVHLTSTELRDPVVKEESTRVYSDE